MRVVKIYKSGSSFLKKHFLVFLDLVDDEEIEDAVVEWAREDLSGQNNGYTVRWEDITDEAVIKEVLKNKIAFCDARIKYYQEDKTAFLNELQKISFKI